MTTFDAPLVASGKTATGISVPQEAVDALGAGKRVPVVVTINGYSYRSTVTPYRGENMLPVSAENREGAGIAAGETITVTLERDDAPRVIEVPDDLALALAANAAAKSAFDALSYSNQRAHVLQVTSAKTDETRARRIAKVVADLV